jgi:hypothetical protein
LNSAFIRYLDACELKVVLRLKFRDQTEGKHDARSRFPDEYGWLLHSFILVLGLTPSSES